MNTASDPPARKVVTRSPIRTVRVINLPGIFASPVECESSLERDFVYRAALCPGVIQLRHQPFQLRVRGGRRYTPDFLVSHADGSQTVIEIKLTRKIDHYRETFDEAAKQLRERSFRFVVVGENKIRAKKSHERAALLLRYRKGSIDPALQQRVLETTGTHTKGISITALEQVCQASRPDIFHLIAARRLSCSRLLPLDGGALVFAFPTQEINDEHFIESWLGVAQWPTHA